MKTPYKTNSSRLFENKSGLTLIELTVVIVILLALVGASMYALGGYKEYKLRMKAETALRAVYTAQRSYLADHPNADPSTISDADVKKYMSDGFNDFPVVKDADGNILTYDLTQSPPVFANDPSGDDKDGKWDLSKK